MGRRRALNETKPVPSNARRWLPWVTARSRRAKFLFVLGCIVLAETVWAAVTYWNGLEGKPELLTYRLCVGQEQRLCPNDATFVRNEGEDTVTKWAQKEYHFSFASARCGGWSSRSRHAARALARGGG